MKYIFFTIFLIFFLVTAFTASAALRSLSLGFSGNDVRDLQTKLIARKYLAPGNASGHFGPLTDAALKQFQCEYGIGCSSDMPGYGVYGPKTRQVLTSKPLEFSGWIPYWRTASGTADVAPHLEGLTSVMPFGYTVKTTGQLYDALKITEEPWVSFIATAKQNHVRVIPSVMWGNGDAIHKILSNTKTRIALEDEIVNTVKQNNFDGIDIDFEAKYHETVDYFSTFLKGLYRRLGKKLVYCTVEARMPLSDRFSPGAVIPPDALDYSNDYMQMNKYCDRIEIMAYDQGTIDVRLNALRTPPYAPIADPNWVESVVTLAAQTIPKNKIILGVPTYGYEYKVTPVAGGTYQYKVLWPFNQKYAFNIAARLGATTSRNEAGEIGFKYDPKLLADVAPTSTESTQTQEGIASSSIALNDYSTSTTTSATTTQGASTTLAAAPPFNYLSWSDSRAIADKIILAHKLGVRGVAVFKFDGGEDQAMWNVLR